MRFLLLFIFCLSCNQVRTLQAADVIPAVTGTKSVQLQALSGEIIPLPAKGQNKWTVLCFLGNECPLARLYAPRLQRLADDHAENGLQFIGINSNPQDSIEEIQQYTQEVGLKFPMAKDHDQSIARHYQITRTPEVILLDPLGTIQYRGRIDDQYLPGVIKPAPQREDLRLAINAALSGQAGSVPATSAVGCLISWADRKEVTTELTYCKDIVRILQRNCVECHQAGEIGPFALTDYQEVIGWAEMSVEVIEQKRMPPWHANPAHGEFRNSRFMTQEDQEKFREWARGGTPYGNPEHLPASISKQPDIQQGPQADLTLTMRERPFQIPAEGVVDYQYFVVDPGFETDRWVRQSIVMPGNRAVVHHVIVFVRPPDGSRFRGLGFIGAYVPGQVSTSLPEGYARRVPAGSRLVFQMHYTPNGSQQQDLTSLQLYFADDEEITHEVVTGLAINRNFEIPPGKQDFAISAAWDKLPEDGQLLSITPHMHYRGKSMRVWGKTGDTQEVLLDVPYYDFNWQHVYELKQPRPLSDFQAFSFQAVFDNSEQNPFNPDPSAYVRWGDQSDEEMAIAFFDVAVKKQGAWSWQNRPESAEQSTQGLQDEVAKFFSLHDQNGDGIVTRNEMPLSVQQFAFRRYDKNRDLIITKKEIADYLERR